jgi:hypothetical protein
VSFASSGIVSCLEISGLRMLPVVNVDVDIGAVDGPEHEAHASRRKEFETYPELMEDITER